MMDEGKRRRAENGGKGSSYCCATVLRVAALGTAMLLRSNAHIAAAGWEDIRVGEV
jgi:hypothetical protein